MVSQNAGKSMTGHPNAFPFETENPSGVPGITEIEGDVIAAIAGHVASRVDGVERLGAGGIIRTIVDTVRSTSAAKAAGVGVESGKKEAILDLEVTITYGHVIPRVVQDIREAVARDLFNLVGLAAKEINVTVVGIEFSSR